MSLIWLDYQYDTVPRDLQDCPHTAGAAALLDAAADNDTQQLKWLIGNGSSSNAAEDDGRTALHEAARCECVEAIHTLLRAGAHPGVASDAGDLPLHEAAAGGQAEAISALMASRKAPHVDCVGRDGVTALLLAARKGHAAAVTVLVRLGASLSATDGQGKAALHCAAQNGKLEAVKALLAAGADKGLRASSGLGLTALQLAERGRHTQVVQLLRGSEVGELLAGCWWLGAACRVARAWGWSMVEPAPCMGFSPDSQRHAGPHT